MVIPVARVPLLVAAESGSFSVLHSEPHTPSIAFLLQTARFSYATDAVSALRKVPVLI